MVFVALDVGKGHMPVTLLHQADGDTRDRVDDRNTSVHQRQGATADAGHAGAAIGLKNVRHQTDSVRKNIRSGNNAAQRTLGQGAVAKLATTRATQRLALAHRERGEVVVEHELLVELFGEPLDALLVGRGAQGDGDQGLGLATLEKSRAMHTGQQAGFAEKRTDIIHATAIDTLAVEGGIADHLLFEGR